MRRHNAHSRGLRVEGFEFDVEHGGERRTVLLHGAGGCEGAGWLCALNGPDTLRSPEQAAEVLLGKLCARIDAGGTLREHRPHTRGGGSFDVVELVGATLLACRPRLFPLTAGARA